MFYQSKQYPICLPKLTDKKQRDYLVIKIIIGVTIIPYSAVNLLCTYLVMMSRYGCIICIVYFSIIAFIDTKRYKVTPISSTKCETPTDKMDPTRPVMYDTGVKAINRHTKVVRTNFTVLRFAGPITLSLKINHLKRASKEEIFKLEKVDCQNPVTYQLIRVVNLNLTNDCMVMPGNYLTENINLQDFAWILTKAMVSPGRYEYILQFYSEKGLAVCNSIVADIKEK